MYKELKAYVLPQETGFIHTTTLKRNVRTLNKMCSFSQMYYDPEELPAMFEEFTPYVGYLQSFRYLAGIMGY